MSITITPTWSGMLPAFLVAMEAGTDAGKSLARTELERMAKHADAHVRARDALKSWRMSREDVGRLKKGDVVRLTCKGFGDVDMGEDGQQERHYEPGALAEVASLDHYEGQGLAVTVVVMNGPGQFVVNVFDESDADAYPFAHVSPAVAALAILAHQAKFHDDELNEGNGDEGPKAPDGDDYNELFSAVQASAAVLDMPHAVGPLSATGLDNRCISAIMAGLSLLRDHAQDGYDEETVRDMASDAYGTPCEPLSADEITALINSL